LVSIKGRIENGNIIVAESISFLNSNWNKERIKRG
jgi:hypothetical protein